MLAAIIYVNLHGMIKQFMDIPALWRSNKVDMVSVLKTDKEMVNVWKDIFINILVSGYTAPMIISVYFSIKY